MADSGAVDLALPENYQQSDGSVLIPEVLRPLVGRIGLNPMKSQKKTFDCVAKKRRGAEQIHEATKGLTLEQKIDYWHRQSEQFRREIGRHTPKGPPTRTYPQENPGT